MTGITCTFVACRGCAPGEQALDYLRPRTMCNTQLLDPTKPIVPKPKDGVSVVFVVAPPTVCPDQYLHLQPMRSSKKAPGEETSEAEQVLMRWLVANSDWTLRADYVCLISGRTVNGAPFVGSSLEAFESRLRNVRDTLVSLGN